MVVRASKIFTEFEVAVASSDYITQLSASLSDCSFIKHRPIFSGYHVDSMFLIYSHILLYSKNTQRKKRSEIRKHCALAVVR